MASRRSWVRIPSAPPILLFSITFDNFQGALNRFRSQHHAHHFAVRFVFACVHSFAIYVHRSANVGVAHGWLGVFLEPKWSNARIVPGAPAGYCSWRRLMKPA